MSILKVITVNKLSFLFLLILISGIQSCTDLTDPFTPINNDFVYPLKIGNKWNYNVSNVFSNIRPDSIKTLFTNTSFDLQVSVTKNTFLNSIQVYEMKEESKEYSDSYAYYSNEEKGFIKYAYSNNPSNGLPKTNTIKRFLYKGTYFNSLTELIKKQEETIFALKKLNDSLIFLEPPRIIYAYPLEVGKEWIFSSSIVLINKEVVGKENVKTDFGIYECIKIRWKYDFDMDGNWDDDFIYYEYVSSKGLLKNTYTIKDIDISTAEYPDGIGKADVKYERILTGINF